MNSAISGKEATEKLCDGTFSDAIPLTYTSTNPNPQSLVASTNTWNGRLAYTMLAASLASLNYGFNISVMNSPASIFETCPIERDANYWNIPVKFPFDCFHVNLTRIGHVVAAMTLGALVASLITGSLANKQGRRSCLIGLNIPFILGNLLMSFSPNVGTLVLGRFFIGMGCGAACIVVPMYLAEISATDVRGFVGSAHQMAIVSGIVLADLAGYLGLAKLFYWRFLFAIGLILSLLQLTMMLWAPESPAFLAHKSELHKTRQSLMMLRGNAYSEQEYMALIESNSTNNGSSSTPTWSIRTLFQHYRESGKSILVSVAMLSGQQLSGINVVFYFSSILFGSNSNAGPSIIPLVFSIVNCLVTVPAIYMTERLGRRRLLMFSTTGVVICAALATVFFFINSKAGSMLAVLAYVVAFALGLGPVPWLLANEVFPVYAHAAASSVANTSSWLSNMFVAFTFPYFEKWLGNAIFVPYGAFMIGLLCFIIFMVPETKGKPMQFVR